MTDPKPKAIPYVRQSQGRHDETEETSLSLQQQEASIREWGQRNGYDLLPTVRDWDESGRSMRRPGFAGLKDLARPGVTILVWKYDRFARNLVGQEQAVSELEGLGAAVVSITEPAGKLPRQIMGSISEWYSDQLSERLTAIRAAGARAGKFQGRRPPDGYRRRDTDTVLDRETGGTRERRRGPIVVVPEEAAVIRECYQRVAAGEFMHALTRDFQRRGVVTGAGYPITAVTIRRWLRNPFYRGVVTLKGKEIAKGIHEPIIDDALWFAVQDRLDRNPRTRVHSPNPETSWAEGHVEHACGARMYYAISTRRNASGDVGRYPSFFCRYANGLFACGVAHKAVTASKVEAAIRACLAADLRNLRPLAEAVAIAERAAGGRDAAAKREQLAQRRRAADKRLARARELWLAGDDELAAWEYEKARHKEAIAAIERELASLPAAPDPDRYRAAAAELADVGALLADPEVGGGALRAVLAAVGVLVCAPAGMRVRYRPPFDAFVACPLVVGY